MAFKLGDVVMLKSGGPRMTVAKLDGEFVHCFWFDRSHPFEEKFNQALLQKPSAGASSIRIGRA